MKELILEKAGKNGFDFKVIVNEENGCWECLDRKPRQNGIGHIPYKRTYAHRYFYEKFKGRIPKNKVVRHLCNNARCCNPEHLEIGTKKDNSQNMVKSFRNRNGRKILTKEEIETICKSTKNTKELSEEFGVNSSTINRIKNGSTYSHLNVERISVRKKLNSKQAKEIFESNEDWKELAKKFNVSYSTVYDIKNLKTWGNINGSNNT